MVSIYIDMDDVLCESNQTFIKILDKDFDKQVTYDQITTFDLKKSFNLSDDEYDLFFKRVHDPDEMIQHPVIPGARQLLDTWNRRGYRINILTGRPSAATDISLQWLDRHEFSYHHFSIVNKYNREASNGDGSISLEALSSMSFDLAVEDSGNMARFLSEEMDTAVALLDRPWNRDFNFNSNVHRCADWAHIKKEFESLENRT